MTANLQPAGLFAEKNIISSRTENIIRTLRRRFASCSEAVVFRGAAQLAKK